MIRAIRAPRPKNAEGNIKFADEFWSAEVSGLLPNSIARYSMLVDFPEIPHVPALDVIDAPALGVFLDRLFGLPLLREIAISRWEEAARLTTFSNTKAFQSACDTLRHCDTLSVNDAATKRHVYRIPGHDGRPPVLFTMRSETHYPAGSTRYESDPHNSGGPSWHGAKFTGEALDVRECDFRTMSDEDSALVERIRQWAMDNRVNRAKADAMTDFLEDARQCADSTKSLFDRLPGLQDCLHALGVSRSKLLRAGSRYVGHDVFDIHQFRELRPQWTSEWIEHRTTLVSVAASRETVSNAPPFTLFAVQYPE